MDLDDFVEMTKKYAQGIVPSVPQSGSQVTVKTESPARARDSGGEVKDPIRIKINKYKFVITRTHPFLFLIKIIQDSAYMCVCFEAQGSAGHFRRKEIPQKCLEFWPKWDDAAQEADWSHKNSHGHEIPLNGILFCLVPHLIVFSHIHQI